MVSTDGGVKGFTSWIGFKGRARVGFASSRGVFVLTGSRYASRLGEQEMAMLLEAEPVVIREWPGPAQRRRMP